MRRALLNLLSKSRLTAIAASSILLSGGVLASEGLKSGEQGRVTRVLDGDTLYLDHGADQDLKVRLSGIQAPKLSLGREHVKDWPLGKEARQALIDFTRSKPIELRYGGQARDRYDRALAQVYIGDGADQQVWVQEAMVRAGWARVYSWPDTFQDTALLYEAEREARAEKRGIWGHSFYEIRSPDPNNLAQDVDSFQIVEGIITSTADVRGQVYINFGADYRSDFTVELTKQGKKAFKARGIEPLMLEGARVRVRGWIELKNGPVIYLSDPDRLEILD